MKIGICSWSDREEVYSLTWPKLKEYCDLHKYRFITGTEYFENDVAGSWMKLKMLQKQEGLDYIVWFDDDIIITNEQLSLEGFIKQLPENCTFGIMADSGTTNQPERFIFNMGVMIVKCGGKSLEELTLLWYNGIQSKWRNKRHLEQDYITSEYVNNITFKQSVYKFPYGSLQTFIRPYGLPEEFQWNSGDFAAHITGWQFNNGLKVKRINKFLQQLK